jgi:hypothetical protein
MRKLSKAKWMTASGGIICLAAILALSITLPGKQALRIGRLSHVSRDFRASSAPAVPAASSSHVDVVKHYGQLPLAFEPNSTASSSEAKFLARGNGYALFLANHEAVLELRGPSKSPAVLRMQLAGANPTPRFTALEKLAGTSNYFIGNDPRKWRTNIPQYAKVLERDVYHGVNIVYYGTQGRLEYDFDVAPGTDPSVIQLVFQGARDIQIDAQGELVAHTAAGDVRLRKPVAYQKIAGSKLPVAVGYMLKNSTSASFQVAEYDPRQPLVIDPILIYSSYLGGSNIDSSNSIAVAPDNTAFVAGGTFSSDFPTVHALQPNEGGGPDFPEDAFVAKISADGSTQLYSTYLGGNNQDSANGITVDNFGDAFVTGYTLSPTFPVSTGAYDTLCGGDGKCGASWNPNGDIVSNAFVTELNPAGSGILYSTFLGVYENVKGQAIVVDGNGNAYVTGSTSANITPTVPIIPPNVPPSPFPITANAFQPTFGGGTTNAFVIQIDATGTSLLYSSYLGGDTEDLGYGIAVDNHANAYVTGLTYSTNFPTAGKPLQSTYGGAGDAFLTKVNTTLSGAASLAYSTYLGGAGLDQGNAITVDSNGNPYVAGLTDSSTFGFTPAATVVQPAYNGEGDAFVAEFSTTGTLTYFTYLGGTHADSATGIAVDSTFNVYVTGTTASINFPTAGAVFQPAYGGGNTDSFVAKIGPGGTPLVYSSYLGGTNAELATGIAVDTSGSAYVTGQTCSEDFPLANPFQAVPGGNCDAYVAKVSILAGFSLTPSGLVFPAQSLNTTSQSQTLTLTNGDSQQTISSIAISGTSAGDFTETNTCPILPTPIAVGATCAITVSFSPTAEGVRKASLTITDSAPGSPQVVNLTGNTSTVSLSASSLAFGLQQVGVPSAAQDVTVTNVGTTTLTISSIVASGDFSEIDNCTKASLQPTTNCVIQVTYNPSAAVASIGAVTLTDTGSGSPQEILLTGTGILEPLASLSPASLGFANQAVGTSSAAQGVVLTNTGNASLSISGIVISGTNPADFFQANTCGSILSPGANCAIGVVFTPTAAGSRTATLIVTDNSGNAATTQTVQLLGTGAAVPVVSLSTTSLTFPSTAIGSTSAAQTVTVTNTGSAALMISSVTPTGNFGQSNNCPASIAAGNSCLISITFSPISSGNLFGSVAITDNAANSPQTISMSGVGTGASFQVSSLTPSSSVSAGTTATYAISVTSPNGFSQSVGLNCTAPATMTCSIAPSAVTPTATQTQAATLTVTTEVRTAVPPTSGIKIDPFALLRNFSWMWLIWVALALLLLAVAAVRRRPITVAFGFAVVLLLASVACGGGASGVPAGTPAGTYQITVTGTSGSVSVPTNVTLNIK